MKRGTLLSCFFLFLMVCLNTETLDVQAEIASEDAFEGAAWEMIIEDKIEAPIGVVQSMCATEDYIITLENIADQVADADIVKAYYRNKKDAKGKKVEQYSLAKRVQETNYEHANGMAYNPEKKEIAVALYTADNPENRGCIFLMDAKTLKFKERVKISDEYNILGIDYDEEKKQYIIQTNVEGGYSFLILDENFQIVDNLGSFAHTAKGDNFQDLCVSGDYIINFPLTLNLGIGDYIHMYSVSRREMVSDAQLDFQFQNVIMDEPESICELEPGVFAAAVNVTYGDGRRNICIYKTMVPYNFPVKAEGIGKDESKGNKGDATQLVASDSKKNAGSLAKKIWKVLFLLVLSGIAALAAYMRYVTVKRERKRKLERARRQRERIRAMYEEEEQQEYEWK